MEEPVPRNVPPQLPLYHFQLAPVPKLPPTTVRVDESVRHIVPLEALTDVGAVEGVLTVMFIDLQIVVLQVPSARNQ